MSRRRLSLLVALGLAVVGASVLSLTVGPADLSLREVWQALLPVGGADAAAQTGGGGEGGEGGEGARTIVRLVRAPRTVTALLAGGALALSGAVLQALLRNPLAEPYVLGLSGGAALGAVLAIVTGFLGNWAWTLPGASFVGALLAVAAVLRVASGPAGFDARVLILAGVVVGAFFNAAIMLLLTFAEAEALRSAIFWTMGSFGTASWQGAGLLALYVIPAALLLWSRSRALDLLMIGEDTAAYLGTNVKAAKLAAYGLASLLAAASVAVAGIIGFVGLVIPHTARMLWGSDHRFLLPAAFLAGAAFLVGADVAARMLAEPSEIPVGVVTAFVGVPVFVLLLRREARR